MALPPLVTVAALSDWLGEPIADDDARAGAVLRAASLLVRREAGRDWLTDDEPLTLDESTPAITADDLEVAQTVVKQVAARVWSNPTGVIHETTGPFSARYAEDVAQGLFLTDTEKELLGAYRTSTRYGLYTIATTREAPVGVSDLGIVAADGTVYAPVEPDGQPIPWLDDSQELA